MTEPRRPVLGRLVPGEALRPRHGPRRRGLPAPSPARSSPSSATTARASPPSSRRSPAQSFPMRGEILLDGKPVRFHSPLDARRQGIETVYQDLAVAPADVHRENLFSGASRRTACSAGSGARQEADAGPRRCVTCRAEDRHPFDEAGRGDALRRQRQASPWPGSGRVLPGHVVIMDEPTPRLGVKEATWCLELIRRVRDRGLPVILISHKHAARVRDRDRIHIARLGKRAAVVNPKKHIEACRIRSAVVTGAKAAGRAAGANVRLRQGQ